MAFRHTHLHFSTHSYRSVGAYTMDPMDMKIMQGEMGGKVLVVQGNWYHKHRVSGDTSCEGVGGDELAIQE